MLCWHRRARKTTFALNLLIREAYKYPKQVYGYIAPTYTQAKAIVWRDPNMFFKYIPEDIILRKNESELFVELTNHSIIALKGADNPDSIRGQDYRGVICDEFALMKSLVWEEILRPIITQSKDRWAIFAFTPKGRNFVYDYWLKSDYWSEWYKSFLPASRTNIIPADELVKAREQMPEELYMQEFECSFLADEENTLISAKSVENLRSVRVNEKQIRRIISCDPSQGGDECVIYFFENSEIKETKILRLKDTMLIVGEIASMMYRTQTDYAAVDVIGIGAGVYDRLREMGKNVIGIQSAEKSYDSTKFYNKRAEIWWYVMEQIRDGKIAFPEDAELRRELSFVKYRVVNSNGQIQLEPKSDTKERLGRSPDRADAFVYGIYALTQVSPSKPKDRWSDNNYRSELGVGATSAMVA